MQVYNNTRIGKNQVKKGFFNTIQLLASKVDKKKIEEEKKQAERQQQEEAKKTQKEQKEKLAKTQIQESFVNDTKPQNQLDYLGKTNLKLTMLALAF